MVAYCVATLAGETCTGGDCSNRHDIIRCESCHCSFPADLLSQHSNGKKHLRNAQVAANGTSNPVTPYRPPPPPSNLPNSQFVSFPSTASPGTSVPTAVTSDKRVTMSHEDGLDFEVEGYEVARRPSFPPHDLTILIVKTEVVSSLSVAVKLFPSTGTLESCFTASVIREAVRRKKPSKILVSFQPPHPGAFRTSLQIIFSDNTRPSDKKISFLRELRGRATLTGTHVGIAHSVMPFPSSNRVDDQAVLSTDEEGVFLDSENTGISVSGDRVVDFGVVGRSALNGPFYTSSSSVTIDHAEGFPSVTFVEAKIRSRDGSDSSFKATFEGRSRSIRAGTKSTVQIEFVPEFEGLFEATLQLIFAKTQQSERFAVSTELQAVAGSLEDHKRFESLNQGRHIPSSERSSGRQGGRGGRVPPESIIPLPSLAGQFGRLPEYELPVKVQEAVNSVTHENPYENQAKYLINDLVPKKLAMDTYAQYYRALLNVEEGHQQRDILDQHPIKVDVQMRDSRYFVELKNKDEDHLPEVHKGDFLWLDDEKEDVRYDTRITNTHVFMRSSLAVLKIFLQVPASFNLHHGVQFLLRFRLNRITLRRQHHALASPLAHLRRLFFPCASDIKPIHCLSEAEIAELQLISENIRDDKQQLQTVASILQQPKGAVPFVIFGPPGTGKTSTVVESIMQLVRRDASSKILACTPSNAAADLLVERLATAGLTVDELFRLNAHSRDINSIPENIRPFSTSPKPSKLRACRVVLSTCSSAALLQTLKIRVGHFSHIIIDEAAQADEPLSLIPIAFFSNEDTNIIIAGDPNQLGPVIKSEPASKAGLGESYLGRLMLISEIYGLDTQAGNTIVGLQLNRRSHGAIIAWPNRYLYEDIMRARASPEVARLLLQSDVLPKKGFPIVFHGIRGLEVRNRSPSYLNIHEASVVRDYCLRLTKDHEHEICAEEIGVIAPYKAQVRAIRELLRHAGLKGVCVGSVEKFQGQERKVIIFATTRSNLEVDKRKAMGFLQNRRRMNVAITRAQSLLIVVGDPEVLGKDDLLRTFLNYACLREGWTGKPLRWDPKEDVNVPGYEVIKRLSGVVRGESYMDGKNEMIYRFFSREEGSTSSQPG